MGQRKCRRAWKADGTLLDNRKHSQPRWLRQSLLAAAAVFRATTVAGATVPRAAGAARAAAVLATGLAVAAAVIMTGGAVAVAVVVTGLAVAAAIVTTRVAVAAAMVMTGITVATAVLVTGLAVAVATVTVATRGGKTLAVVLVFRIRTSLSVSRQKTCQHQAGQQTAQLNLVHGSTLLRLMPGRGFPRRLWAAAKSRTRLLPLTG
jgi:hypothetical protein